MVKTRLALRQLDLLVVIIVGLGTDAALADVPVKLEALEEYNTEVLDLLQPLLVAANDITQVSLDSAGNTSAALMEFGTAAMTVDSLVNLSASTITDLKGEWPPAPQEGKPEKSGISLSETFQMVQVLLIGLVVLVLALNLSAKRRAQLFSLGGAKPGPDGGVDRAENSQDRAQSTAHDSGTSTDNRSADPEPVDSSQTALEGNEDIRWIKELRGALVQHIEEATIEISDNRWQQIEEREKSLQGFRTAFDDLMLEMDSDDTLDFKMLVENRLKGAQEQLSSLLTFRAAKTQAEDPISLLKGALVGAELLDETRLDSLLRRTEARDLILLFLPEVDQRLTKKGSEGGQKVYDKLSPLCGRNLHLLVARQGEDFNNERQTNIGHEQKMGVQRGQIVRYEAHGIMGGNNEVLLKTKVVLAM